MFSKTSKRAFAFLLSFVLVLTSFVSFAGTKQVLAASKAGLTLKVEAGNGWNDGKADYQQFNCTLTNESSSTVSDWEIAFTFAAGAVLNQGWCGTYDMADDGTLTITASDSNAKLSVGGSTTFGFIVINGGTWSDDNVKVVKPASGETPATTEAPAVTSEAPVVTSNAPAASEEPKPSETAAVPSPTVSTPAVSQDWLYTDGSRILDKNGKQVWLTGLNWFGFNTGTNCFDGMWACDVDKALTEIANRGFNLLRVPISSELLLDWKNGEYPKACLTTYGINEYLQDKNSLEIFDHVIDKCNELGLKIMIDIHSVETNAAGHYAPLWYTENVTEGMYLDSLDWISDRYKADDTIIAYDLKNEPHGKIQETSKAIWNDSEDENNWKHEAEVAGLTVLRNNPNALIMVEGTEVYPMDVENNSDFHIKDPKQYYGTWWGGNLRGVKDFPVNLGEYQNKLVYSPHDYGPSVFNQEWFHDGDFTTESLNADCWYDNWYYIQDQNIAPLLIGEWGGFMDGGNNQKWMECLRDFIKENKINHTFWCYNANSGDTGGLVGYDFSTWEEDKYALVEDALWKVDGKFVGLSQDTPLGTKGTCVGAISNYHVTE